jgi:diadenosine tetraphosphatase ApaH/serine/threonine PP2A family protein phosphatase
VPTAVISDVHANAAALRAVLADIDSRGITRIVCLGDTVGYGPDPLECVDLVMQRTTWCLMGNHDYGVLYEPTNFNAGAESSAYWTREQFDREPDDAKRAIRYQFLNRLKVRVQERIGPDGPEPLTAPDGTATPESGPSIHLLAVHGSPRKPINEYIFADDVVNASDKLESIFDKISRVCIVGHTHIPGVFTNEPDFYPPSELSAGKFVFQPGEKLIINVGSVGQPRDLDNRASYVVLHSNHVEFARVAYNIDETAKKIREVPQLADWLADRLHKGQ